MLTLLETLAGYLPPTLIRYLAADPRIPDEPVQENLLAAVLFADISGFTALSERLAKSGPQGAEQLTYMLNSYFGELIELITQYGGEVAKFAGDALLALWPTDNTAEHAALGDLTRRAADCALEIQARFKNYQIKGSPKPGEESTRLIRHHRPRSRRPAPPPPTAGSSSRSPRASAAPSA